MLKTVGESLICSHASKKSEILERSRAEADRDGRFGKKYIGFGRSRIRRGSAVISSEIYVETNEKATVRAKFECRSSMVNGRSAATFETTPRGRIKYYERESRIVFVDPHKGRLRTG